MADMNSFRNPPPKTTFTLLSFPTPHVLLVTLNRPEKLNCINNAGHWELHHIWEWLDQEPSLRVGIVTGSGRAFCAGADLKEWLSSTKSSSSTTASFPPSGFGGLSRRRGKKPIIAAVNGLAHGGGCEMIINCDIVLASSSAQFALPEVKRGVAAIAGALPRLTRIVGRQRAMQMALTGREITAQQAEQWGLVNAVVEVEGRVVAKAVEWAKEIAGNSPDSIVVSKEGIKLGWEGIGVEEATDKLVQGTWRKVEHGENLREGIQSFVEKRRPKWVESKL